MDIEKPGYWAVLPAKVRYDPQLPHGAKLLYAEISALTDQSGYCFASNAYFEALYSLSKRTIQEYLTALKRGGYIQIVDGAGGKQTRKIYAGINPMLQQPKPTAEQVPRAENCTGGCENLHGGRAEICTHNKINNKKDYQEPPKAPQGAAGEIWDPEAFERFWKRYPKKKDKVKAIREWNKLKADRKLMREMSAALGVQMASEEWQRDNGRAIPYPCRWLSHRRWEDVPDVEVEESGIIYDGEDLPEWT